MTTGGKILEFKFVEATFLFVYRNWSNKNRSGDFVDDFGRMFFEKCDYQKLMKISAGNSHLDVCFFEKIIPETPETLLHFFGFSKTSKIFG